MAIIQVESGSFRSIKLVWYNEVAQELGPKARRLLLEAILWLDK